MNDLVSHDHTSNTYISAKEFAITIIAYIFAQLNLFCMHDERYPLTTDDDHHAFEFLSQGPKGSIKKVIVYQPLPQNYYNLAFGDWDEMAQDIVDSNRSNNGDMEKVLATVASTIPTFLGNKPNALVLFRGNTAAKNRVYQIGINKHLAELTKAFDVRGVTSKGPEPFRSGKNYEGFIIQNKK